MYALWNLINLHFISSTFNLFRFYSYEGGDGTKAFESGKLKEYDDDRTGEAVVGGFSYKVKKSVVKF